MTESTMSWRRRRQLESAAVALAASSPVAVAQVCQWEAMSGAATFDMGRVRSMAVYGDGAGPALYVGGTFRESLGGPGNHVAKWDGSEWRPLASGIGNTVYTLEVFDDGSGVALYVGGIFRRAGMVDGNSIARWDGQEWSALGSGMYNPGPFGPNHIVRALEVFDDGSGPALYAAGKFIEAGGVPAHNIARWNGQAWSAVGEGLSLAGKAQPEVLSMAVHDDGTGPALYAAGAIDGWAQRWDGQTWEIVGNLSGRGDAMCVYDDGAGPALYAGGQILLPGGSHLAKWNSANWSSHAGGANFAVRSLGTYDDGTGLGLYVGGAFSQAGPVSTWGIARWDGQWSALGAGLYNFPFGPSADAMAVFDDGSGPALYVGGEFSEAGGVPVNSIARWKCEICKADCDRNTSLDIFDFLCFQAAFIAGEPYADCDGNQTHDIFDYLCFQDEFVQGCP